MQRDEKQSQYIVLFSLSTENDLFEKRLLKRHLCDPDNWSILNYNVIVHVKCPHSAIFPLMHFCSDLLIALFGVFRQRFKYFLLQTSAGQWPFFQISFCWIHSKSSRSLLPCAGEYIKNKYFKGYYFLFKLILETNNPNMNYKTKIFENIRSQNCSRFTCLTLKQIKI